MMKFDKNYISDEALERLDDARFALLMEGYSARKGEACMEENLRLQEDGSFELSPELDEKCMKAIDAAFARKRRRAGLDKAKSIAKRVTVAAASFLVVATLSTVVLYNTVEAFRLRIVDYTINLFEVGEGSIVSVKANEETADKNIIPTWLPDGYEIETDKSNSSTKMIKYSNGEKTIRYISSSIGIYAVDTENSTSCYNTEVMGYDAMVVTKEQETFLYWFDYESNTMFSLWINSIDFDTLQRMAESCYN